MILEIIDSLITMGRDLSEEDAIYLGFVPGISPELTSRLLKMGWWHILFLGQTEYVQFGIRILPYLKWEQWPIVMLRQKQRAVTFASSLATFLPLLQFYLANENREIFCDIRENWSSIEKLMAPFHRILTGDDNALKKMEQFLNDDSNLPSTLCNSDEAGHRLTKFWLLFDETPEHKYMHKVIDEMLDDEEVVPSLPGDDYGIWETRLANITASRAWINNKVPHADLSMWRGYVQSDGYDAEMVHVRHLPDESLDAYMSTYELANQLGAEYFKKSEIILEDPLFPSVKSIIEKGKGGYAGQEHLLAAAVLDDRLEKPKRAWHALVSGSYWSGRNDSRFIAPTLEAAIHLCDKHGWKVSSEVLRHNQQFLI